MTRTALALALLLVAPACDRAACADGQQNPCVCTGSVGHPSGTQVCDGGKYGACDCSAAEAASKAEAEALAREAQAEAKKLAKITGELEDLKSEQSSLEIQREVLDKSLSMAESEDVRAKLLAKKQALEAKIAENEEDQATSDRTPPTRKSRLNLGAGDDPLEDL